MYPGQDWKALTPGTMLTSGAVIKTGGGAFVYMAVNQKTSAVRVNENSVLALEKMQQLGTAEKDTDTTLDIRSGTVAGDVKKLAKASHFDIRTPNGVAGIRGTSWSITVTVSSGNDQLYQISVSCINGQIVYAYRGTDAASAPVTVVVNEQQQIVIKSGDQQVVTPATLTSLQSQPLIAQISDLSVKVEASPINPEPSPTPTPTPAPPTPAPAPAPPEQNTSPVVP